MAKKRGVRPGNIEEPDVLKEIDREISYSLGDVPSEFRFWTADGRQLRNLKELLEALKNMHTSIFEEHANKEKNDFANWVEDIIKNPELASELRLKKTREEAIRAVEAALNPRPETKIMKIKERAAGAIRKVKGLSERLKIRPGQKIKPIKPEPVIKKMPEIKAMPKALPEKASKSIAEKQKQVTPLAAKKQIEKAISRAKLPNLMEQLGKPSKAHPRLKELNELRQREKALLDKQRELEEEEARLNEKKLRMLRQRHEILKGLGEIEQEKFNLFMETGLMLDKPPMRTPEELFPKESLKEGEGHFIQGTEKLEIASLLREIRDLIKSGSIGPAREKLAQARESMTSAFMPETDKKRFTYDIYELETDLKLASLNS